MNPQALVLSGGGTRGAFEAGAIGFLVGHGMTCPDIITGTSAGAISAAVLAQARGEDEFAQCAVTLRDDIMAMSDVELVFAKTSWARKLDGTPAGDLMDRAIAYDRPPAPPDAGLTHDPLAPKTSEHEGHKSLRHVAATLMHPKAVRQARADFWNEPGSVMTLDPLEEALRRGGPSGIAPIDEDRIGRPGLTLRLTVTALGAGVPRFITETGLMVDSDARTPYPRGGAPGVIEGALASSSVPLLFRPRQLGDDIYVDGGVVRNLPLEAAVYLGAGDITAILASTIAPPPLAPRPEGMTLLEVFARSAEIELYEQVMRSLAFPLNTGANLRTIAPTMDVVAAFEVHRGLLGIDIDYGWLRAAEVVGLPESARAAAATYSDGITAGRVRAWYLEEMQMDASAAAAAAEQAGAPLPPSDPSVTTALESAKEMVRANVAAWKSLSLPAPDGMAAWAAQPEAHDRISSATTS